MILKTNKMWVNSGKPEIIYLCRKHFSAINNMIGSQWNITVTFSGNVENV